jgi:serine/threonine kinase 16
MSTSIPILLIYSICGNNNSNNTTTPLLEHTPNALPLGNLPIATKIRNQPLINWAEIRRRARGLIKNHDVVFVKNDDEDEWILIEGDDDYVKPSQDGLLYIKFVPAAIPRGNTVITGNITNNTKSSKTTSSAATTSRSSSPPITSHSSSTLPSSSSHTHKSTNSNHHHSSESTTTTANNNNPNPNPKREAEIMLQEAAEAAKKMSSMFGSTISLWAKQAGETAVSLGEVAQQRITQQQHHEESIGSLRIRIGKKLADGGFSEVFHAKNSSTNEPLALKKCRAQTREQLEQLKREIKAHHMLSNEEYILKLLASDQQDMGNNRWVIRMVFPLCEGGSWLDRINQFNEQDHLQIFIGAARGLQAMHAHSLLHRDIKPHNILLTGNGQPLVMDLGSSCPCPIIVNNKSTASLLAEEAAQHCSAPYRAPELYEPKVGKNLGPEIDVWSLGASLFAVTYGKGYSPFEDPVQGVLKLAILNGTPIKFPSSTVNKFSNVVKQIVIQTLVREGNERPNMDTLIQLAEQGLGVDDDDNNNGG